MNSKLTTAVLGVLLIAALAFSINTGMQLSQARNDRQTCEEKYGEALVDAQEAVKRLKEKENEVKELLLVAEAERVRAEEALAELQKKTRK